MSWIPSWYWAIPTWVRWFFCLWLASSAYVSAYDRWLPKSDAEWAKFLLERRFFGGVTAAARSLGWNLPGFLRGLRVFAGKLPGYLIAALGTPPVARAQALKELAKDAVDAAVDAAKVEGAAEPPGASDATKAIAAAVQDGRIEPAEGVAAIAATKDSKKGPPFLMLLVLALVSVLALANVGCSEARQRAIRSANEQRAGGHASARGLDEVCDYVGAESLPTKAERKARSSELDAAGCRVALNAQTALSEAHRAQVRAIEAAQAGKCAAIAAPVPASCDLVAMALKTYEAGVALGNAAAAVQGAVAAQESRKP